MLERERRFWRRRAWYLRPPYVLANALGGFGALLVVGQLSMGREIEPESVFPFVSCFAFAAHFFTGGGAVSVIAGEVQAGTVHLLLLTGMRPRDLVAGQFVCGMLVAGWGVLGLVPWLWVGWLNSPLIVGDLGWVVLLWGLTGTTFHGALLCWASFGKTTAQGLVSGLVPILFWMGRDWLLDVFGAPTVLAGGPWATLALYAGLGVASAGLLALATWRLRRSGREPFLERASSRTARRGWIGWLVGGRRPEGEARRRLLDANPVAWQGAASTPGWAWLLVTAGVVWGGWASWSSGQNGPLWTAGCATRAALLVLVSFQAYGQVRADVAEGTWEPVMRTTITPSEYLRGQCSAWWRQQLGPLAVVALGPALVAAARSIIQEGGWEDALLMAMSGIVLTTADAALAGVWFLGAALKLDGARFYYAAVLAGAILGVVQVMHAFQATEWRAWPWCWAVIAFVLLALSWKACRDDLVVELEEAAGKPDARTRWFEIR